LIIPLKGFIVANGNTDYKSDPNIFTIEMLNAFNLIPQTLYEPYQERNCKVPWIFLWFNLKVIPVPDLQCAKFFLDGVK